MSRLPGCCALWLALASGLMLTASAAQAAAETASAELTALTGIVEASLQQEPVDVEARLRASLRLLELLAARDQGRGLLASKAPPATVPAGHCCGWPAGMSASRCWRGCWLT
jgi:hypothetical protein